MPLWPEQNSQVSSLVMEISNLPLTTLKLRKNNVVCLKFDNVFNSNFHLIFF